MPKNGELGNLENWAHNRNLILKSGRCSHFIPGGLDDDAKQELIDKLDEQDKSKELFTAISEDEKVGGIASWNENHAAEETRGIPAWNVKFEGD